ncbi:MAG: sigma-54 dependent transcriptional regulator [Holosporaceae bacterium]|jgi:DNA-binding NtrC family response regulator|nr:sigma-54 dependent transcriptional regulator [Holosporaceae bacterium]
MKIIVVGEKLEHFLFEIVKISKMLECNLLFFKQNIKTQMDPNDVIIIDGDLIHLLPSEIKNTVISIVGSPNYVASLGNEVSITSHSIRSIEEIIRNRAANHHAQIIVVDPAAKNAFRIADRIAPTDATVLITGETGTGKEVIAKYIHGKSRRSSQKYVAINCAAIPESLLEAELFGHEKGAFTNAIQRRIGKFEEASGGTLLLDEISEMPLGLQSKLLRVVQEKEITRLGGNETIGVDVRIIATSNRDLYRATLDGNFREDLFYRLNVIPIEMPKLNDRPLDIEPLANFFCEKYAGGSKSLSNRFIMSLKNHSWKGNIRELENIVQRATLLSSEEIIDDFFPDKNFQIKTLQQAEKDLILDTLEKFNGNKTLTSKKLDIPLRTLHHKLSAYKVS